MQERGGPVVKRKGDGCHASMRQSPAPFAEAEKSDRLETDP